MSDALGRGIAKAGFALILAAVMWTIIASMVFLIGTGLYHYFAHPFYQWWLYAFSGSDNPRVLLWLKIGAGIGVLPPAIIVIAIISQSRRVQGPRLRRPLFGGRVKSPLAVTDNHGRAEFMSMDQARDRFSGPNPVYGGVVVGEAYRVDEDKVAKKRFKPQDSSTWGKGGKASLLIDPCEDGPSHSILTVGSGGFKTTSAISTMLYWTGSCVVLDPAGEIAPMVREAREKMGHTVHELDLRSGVGFNALDWIDITSPETSTNIDAVVSWICGDPPKGLDKDKDYFDTMGRNVVRALLAHLLFDPDAPAEVKTLRTLRSAIAEPAEKIRLLLRSIYETSPSQLARQHAGPIYGVVDETFSGIVTSAAEMTGWLANEAYSNLVSGNSFKTSDILDGKTSVFLKMPMKVLETEPGVSRTVIGALLNAAYEADGNVNGRILYLLDEVARLGYMKILETARDAGRKYGITTQLLYQSKGQMIDQWGEHGTRAWYDSVSYRAYAAVQDLETARELEETFGTYGVMASSEGMNTGKAGKAMESSSISRGSNVSYHEISRPLIRKAELMQETRTDELFVVMRSARPLRCGRAIYFRRPELNARVAANRFYKGTQEGKG